MKFFDGSVVTNTSYCQFDFDSNAAGQPVPTGLSSGDAEHVPAERAEPRAVLLQRVRERSPGDPVDVTLTVPFPFVNHGANPTHVYNGFTITAARQLRASARVRTCLAGSRSRPPSTRSRQTALRSSSWATTARKTFGRPPTIRVTGKIPSSGYAYITSHMEYGLLKTAAVDEKRRDRDQASNYGEHPRADDLHASTRRCRAMRRSRASTSSRRSPARSA